MQTKNVNVSQDQRNRDNQKMDLASDRPLVQQQTSVSTPADLDTSFELPESASPPAYRMPPAPAPEALPGAPHALPSHALHTHSAKFPIEREVIVSCGDKSPKVPLLQEARRRARLAAGAGASVAPDTPPKPLAAWTHPEKQMMGGPDSLDSPQSLQPVGATSTPKEQPRPGKSVSRTYHSLKDMLSSKFKSKEVGEPDAVHHPPALNNCETQRPNQQSPQAPAAASPALVLQHHVGYGRPAGALSPPPLLHKAPVHNSPYGPAVTAHGLVSHRPSPALLGTARSQEVLTSRALGADALYTAHAPLVRRAPLPHDRTDLRPLAFTSLKHPAPHSQSDVSHSRADLRSPQQLERELIRQRGLAEGRRAASQPHLLDEPSAPGPSVAHRPAASPTATGSPSRRNSYGNVLESATSQNTGRPFDAMAHRSADERESDDGGFRARLLAQGRSSFEERVRSAAGTAAERLREPTQQRRTADNLQRRTPEPYPDALGRRPTDCAVARTAATHSPQPGSSTRVPPRLGDPKPPAKSNATGSGASSDYDKHGGQSSNVDSGRGSVAYSSGRHVAASPHDTSADSDPPAPHQPHQAPAPPISTPAAVGGENEWADLVECELRHILEPKLAALRLDTSASSMSSVTPPLPPLSPASDNRPHESSRAARSGECAEERRVRGRDSPPRWHPHTHKKHSSKRDHHYKKHLFGLDTPELTSTTTRSLDLSSLLDARSDSDVSAGDARAIRRQLRGLENMYAEVLQLLGVRKPPPHHPHWDARATAKRRYGSMSSLPSSSVSSRPPRDKRRPEHRTKHDLKNINKRFQRLEAHVVTLARSVAHLSSEMRTQHLVVQEMDAIRGELSALRHMYKSQAQLRAGPQPGDPHAFSNPDRVRRLTKFFGDEPPLMRLFLKKLGYEKYAALLEKEKVGAAELPYVGEERLRALGVPLGPRVRILREAGLHRDHRHSDHTTTTLAIV